MTGKTNAKKTASTPVAGYTLTVMHMAYDDTLPEYIYISFDNGSTWTSFDDVDGDGRCGSEWPNVSSFLVYYDAQGNTLSDVLYTFDGNVPDPTDTSGNIDQHSLLGANSAANAARLDITEDSTFIVVCFEE